MKTNTSILQWLYRIIFDYVIVILCMTISFYTMNPIVFFIAWILIGSRQHAIGIMGHDGAHYRISKNKKLNDLLANLLAFWPIGSTCEGYRRDHLAHHKYIGSIYDPEYPMKSYFNCFKLPTNKTDILIDFLKDLFGIHIMYMLKSAYGLRHKKQLYMIPFWIVILTISFAYNLHWYLLFWILCLPTSFWAFLKFRMWLEHVGSNDTHRIHLKWHERILAPHNN